MEETILDLPEQVTDTRILNSVNEVHVVQNLRNGGSLSAADELGLLGGSELGIKREQLKELLLKFQCVVYRHLHNC